jgi:hypothetical protein
MVYSKPERGWAAFIWEMSGQMGRFETEAMTPEKNRSALPDLSGRWIDRARRSGTVANVVGQPGRESWPTK